MTGLSNRSRCSNVRASFRRLFRVDLDGEANVSDDRGTLAVVVPLMSANTSLKGMLSSIFDTCKNSGLVTSLLTFEVFAIVTQNDKTY